MAPFCGPLVQGHLRVIDHGRQREGVEGKSLTNQVRRLLFRGQTSLKGNLSTLSIFPPPRTIAVWQRIAILTVAFRRGSGGSSWGRDLEKKGNKHRR